MLSGLLIDYELFSRLGNLSKLSVIGHVVIDVAAGVTGVGRGHGWFGVLGAAAEYLISTAH